MVSVSRCDADGKEFAAQRRNGSRGSNQKKRPHYWGHSSKEAKGRKCQERRCKQPIRQPNRSRVRSRERRVKVKRGLFSYCLEKHLPRQNDCSVPENAAFFQAIEKAKLNKSPNLVLPGSASIHVGQKNAHSCTLAAGHYPAEGKSHQGRVYELPATVRSLPGRK
jgi:hypothetical protein